MASEIRTLKDKDIQVLPRTRADAVSTTDGSTVQDKINNIPVISTSISSTSVTTAASSSAVKQAYDKAVSAENKIDTINGKRTLRFTIGTMTAGWTTSDCDYLCDGTADDVEINAAIQALPFTGGEIVILDGTYNITATIAINKDNVKLSGNGAATILKRIWNSTKIEGVITITAGDGECCIANLQIDGNKTIYGSMVNSGIYINASSSNNTITGNICNNNNYGISLSGSSNNTITGNIGSNNDYGISLSGSSNNTITGNTCNGKSYDIYLSNSSNNTISGNTCNGNNYGIFLSGGSNNTITGNIGSNNSNDGIYLSDESSNNTITGNICNNNNACGIYLSYKNSNNTITGNTCNNNANGVYLNNSSNNTITGNTALRGTGTSSDYASIQRTIYLHGASNNYNIIADNNIMGKNYVLDGGTSNTFVNNKYS